MGTYTGTAGNDTIRPGFVSSGVSSSPPGSTPSAAADTIDGLGGRDILNGGGGDDEIVAQGAGTLMRGDAGNDELSYSTADDVVGVTAYGDAGNDAIRFMSSQLNGGSPEGKLSFHGGSGNDTIEPTGTILSDYSDLTIRSYGDAGDDRLEALGLITFSAFDALDPGRNPDELYGGAGNDTYLVREAQDIVSERAGEGYDTVEIDHSPSGLDAYTLGPNIERLIVEEPTNWGTGGCQLTGNELDNVIAATTVGDTVTGAGGNDTLYGGPIGADAAEETGADDLFGGNGNDTIYGVGGNDTISGQSGNDTLYGDAGMDRLGGGSGNDTLYGGSEDDTLAGHSGLDRLSGDGGLDIYDYDSVTESAPGASRDLILQFEGVGAAAGDRIDLSSIDAVPGGDDDAFTFIGTDAFTGAGQVRVTSVGGADTLVEANTAGSSGAELAIVVSDGGAVAPNQWAAGDFIL